MYFQPAEDEEENDYQETIGGRDGIIFIVDCNSKMLEESESDPAKFRRSLACIEATMMNCIINSEKDYVGILFYNTVKSPKPTLYMEKDEKNFKFDSFKNCALYLPMNQISKESIQLIKSMKDSDDLYNFENVYGSSAQNSVKIGDVLWFCSTMISTCNVKLQSTNILLFTDNHLPHARNSTEYLQAFQRGSDLNKLAVCCFDLVPMSAQFSFDPFYKDLVCTINGYDIESDSFLNMESSISSLMSRKLRKDHRKKCQRHMTLTIGNLTFGVGLYNMTRRTKYPKRVKLSRETNEMIVAKRSYVMAEFDEELQEYNVNQSVKVLPSQLKKSQTFGNEKIVFSAEEIASMKQLIEPGIYLLGFKPRSKISVHHYLSPCNFLFYDETTYAGSGMLFRALWEKCMKLNKIAICVMTQRRKTAPKFVALVPQDDLKAPDGQMLRGNGFRLIYLPTEFQIRNLAVFEEKTVPEVTPDGINVFKKVIQKLKFSYQPEMFENSALKNLYSYIEAIAYNTEIETEFEDSLLPDTDIQNEKIQPIIDQLTEIFGTVDLDAKAGKRSAAATTTGSKSKQAKTDGDNVDTDEFARSNENGTLEKYSVALLKNFLTSTGATGLSKLKKAELIERIQEHFK